MSTLIGHLDADCYYVSCERVRHPSLCGQPVGVLGNQGACVIAKSYEMKKAGVKTGVPIWDAVKLCPDGIYIKRDFHWYEVISRRLLDILREVSPKVEYYSIDEMFFGANQLPQAFNKPLACATAALQHHILDQIGIPVSIGISFSKTLAKLGSDSAKPFGCRVLLDEQAIQELLLKQPVEEISGIGRKSQKKLAAHGIMTCHDFFNADRRLIRKLLTVTGEGLWWELHGTSVLPIQTKRPPHKIIARGGSLGEATADPDRIIAWVVRNVERLLEELDYHQVYTRKLALALEYKEGGGWYGRTTLPEDTACFQIVVRAAKDLLQEAQVRQRVYRMHVFAEQLRYRDLVQRSLFECSGLNRRLDEVKRIVNGKVGRFAVRSGETLPLKDIYSDSTHQYDICDVRGKMCF